MSRNLRRLDSSGSGGFDSTKVEMSVVLCLVEVLSVFIDSSDVHNVTKDINRFVLEDFVAGQVVVSDESLSGLLDLTVFWEFSSSQEAGKVVVSIVLVVDFSDLKSVVSQEILDRKWAAFTVTPEAEDFAVIV